jgi:hypothetical protein
MKTQFVTMLIAGLMTATAFADNAQQPQQMNDQQMQAQPMAAPADAQNPPLQTSSAAPANAKNDMSNPSPAASAPNSN